jgi:biopolymer transport protein ExbB
MDLYYYIEKGGVIVYILIALNIIGWTVMIIKFFSLNFFNTTKSSDEVYHFADADNNDAKYSIAKEYIQERMVKAERGLGLIKTIASISPLLGLLGTVIGVLSTFEAISKNGMDDPNIFAGGISLALVTTVAGLVVAIPHYIGYNYLIGKLDKIEAKLYRVLAQKIYGGVS